MFRRGLKEECFPADDVHRDWRSTAHLKCRNEVEDLERSVKLCGRAVADNEHEAGNKTIVTHVSLARAMNDHYLTLLPRTSETVLTIIAPANARKWEERERTGDRLVSTTE